MNKQAKIITGKLLLILFIIAGFAYLVYSLPEYTILFSALVIIGFIGVWLKQVADENNQ